MSGLQYRSGSEDYVTEKPVKYGSAPNIMSAWPRSRTNAAGRLSSVCNDHVSPTSDSAPDILEAIHDVGYEAPSPIQEQAIPPLLEGIGRDRPGADRHRQDGGLRAADAPVRRSRRARGAGARADARPASSASRSRRRSRVRGAQGGRRRRRLRRRADPHPAGAAARRRPRRRRHRRARQGPDLAPLADAPLPAGCGARRGRRDARPRLPRGRRADPVADARAARPRCSQRDHAAADPPARRPVPLRPGDGQGQGGDADRRHGRAVRARGQPRATRPTRWSRCSRPSGPTRRSCSCAPRSAATSSTGRCAIAG